MAKTLLNLQNGAVTLIEDSEILTLSLTEGAVIGGGQAAGVLTVKGTGSIILSGPIAIQLGFALINAHLPTVMIPMATAFENMILKGLAAIA
jgi:hypothetical protein